KGVEPDEVFKGIPKGATDLIRAEENVRALPNPPLRIVDSATGCKVRALEDNTSSGNQLPHKKTSLDRTSQLTLIFWIEIQDQSIIIDRLLTDMLNSIHIKGFTKHRRCRGRLGSSCCKGSHTHPRLEPLKVARCRGSTEHLESHLSTLITLLTSSLDRVFKGRVFADISESLPLHKSARSRGNMSLYSRIDSINGVRRLFIGKAVFDIESCISGNERQHDTGVNFQSRIETILERLVTRSTSFCSRKVGSSRFCGR